MIFIHESCHVLNLCERCVELMIVTISGISELDQLFQEKSVTWKTLNWSDQKRSNVDESVDRMVLGAFQKLLEGRFVLLAPRKSLQGLIVVVDVLRVRILQRVRL